MRKHRLCLKRSSTGNRMLRSRDGRARPKHYDAAVEKHVPAVEKTADGFKITVGSVTHPMDADHYIQWITFVADDGITYRKFLAPGEAPEMIIKTDAAGGKAYEYCNKHGLWATQ